MAYSTNNIISNNNPGAQPDNKGRNFYMNIPFEFTIQNLLSRQADGTVIGPMSPMLFAKEMSILTGTKFNRLARIRISDERILQIRENDELTGYDHLLIGRQYDNDLFLSIWVDMGTSGLPVAMRYQSDAACIVTPIYKATNFLFEPAEEEFEAVFNYVFANPGCIAIPERTKQ